jgi:hypothetical protein
MCVYLQLIGFPKAERELKSDEWTICSDLTSECPHEAVAGMRKHFVEHFSQAESWISVKKRSSPSSRNPRIVFVYGTSEKMHIVNKMEVIEATKKWCPEPVGDYNFFSNSTITDQLNFVCNASLLVAIYGGGLSHMF